MKRWPLITGRFIWSRPLRYSYGTSTYKNSIAIITPRKRAKIRVVA